MAVRIIAHRGASAAAPENTLAAFSLARRFGADAIELDARLCASGEVVVFHDRNLARLTGLSGEVAATPLARLRELRVGSEPIPTLEEVLRTEDRPPGLIVELKTDRWNDVQVAARVAKLLRAFGAAERGPVVVSSFNPLALLTLRRIAPEIPRALLVERRGRIHFWRLFSSRILAPSELHLEEALIDRRLVSRIRLPIVAWTVDEPAEAERLVALGVTGLITDRPDILVPAMSRRRLPPPDGERESGPGCG